MVTTIILLASSVNASGTSPHDTGGLAHLRRSALVESVFIKPGKIGSTLRPGGLDLLSMRRSDALATLGEPRKKGASWDKWSRGDIAFHLTYGAAGEVTMVTLMWLPSMPPHLR